MKPVVATVSRVINTGAEPKKVAVTLGLVANAVANMTDKLPVPSVVFDPDAVIVPGPLAPVAPEGPIRPVGPTGPVGPVGPAAPSTEPPSVIVLAVLRYTRLLLEYKPILLPRFRFASTFIKGLAGVKLLKLSAKIVWVVVSTIV